MEEDAYDKFQYVASMIILKCITHVNVYWNLDTIL